MEQAKQDRPKAKDLKELLDKLALLQQGESLYDAFVEALGAIPDRDVQSDVCLNALKYQATQNAGARAKDENDDEEMANLFEEECQRFSKELLDMPGKFREWLKTRREREDAGVRVSIVDVILDSCDCIFCKRRRASQKGNTYVNPEPSESPTEPPPPPDVTQH